MQQINFDARVDENGFLYLKMPPNFAGMEITGKLLYQAHSISLLSQKENKIDISGVKQIVKTGFFGIEQII